MATATPLFNKIRRRIQAHSRKWHRVPDFMHISAEYLPQLRREYLEATGMPFSGSLPTNHPLWWVPVESVPHLRRQFYLGEYPVFGDEPSPITFSPRMTTRKLEAQHA